MLALHGFWSLQGGLCLWAEDSVPAVKSRSQAMRSARPHPFAASASTLAAIHPGKPAEAVLLLPSLRTAPLDSPELVRITPRPPARSKAALLPWTVPVVTLNAAAGLAALSERAPGVRYGASLGYLADVAAFAGELVSRGRVLPGLARDQAGASARWRPFLQGRDAVAMHTFVRAMPPVCRAVPGCDDPHELLTAALGAMVDAAAREALPGDLSLTPPRRGRRPPRLAVTEAWLAALCSQDGRFDADPDEIDILAEALHPWDKAGTGLTGPARATFRLVEATAGPRIDELGADEREADESAAAELGADDSRWRLEFLLQSMADPSLLVPAAQAWADDGSLSRWLIPPAGTAAGRARPGLPGLSRAGRWPAPAAALRARTGR